MTTTVGFGSTWLTPRIREFTEHYPDVTLHLILDDRELDLGMREADVAIRMHEPVQGDLVKRKLVRVHRHIYASPEYLSRNGTPTTIDELADHKLIVYGEEAPTVIANVNWLLMLGDKATKTRLEPSLKVNNIYSTLVAVESGVGIAGLPDYMVQGHSRVTRIIPEVEGPAFDTFFCLPGRTQAFEPCRYFPRLSGEKSSRRTVLEFPEIGSRATSRVLAASEPRHLRPTDACSFLAMQNMHG